MINSIKIIRAKTGWNLSILAKILDIPYITFQKLNAGERNPNAWHMGRITDGFLAISAIEAPALLPDPKPEHAWVLKKLEDLDLKLYRKEKEIAATQEKETKLQNALSWLAAYRIRHTEANPSLVRYWDGLQKETEETLRSMKKSALGQAIAELNLLKQERQYWATLLEEVSKT
jgi:hypothetical protein